MYQVILIFIIYKQTGDKHGEKLVDTATKTGLDAAKTTLKK